MRRPLLLNGFMASGKSTVGALVAQATGRPFIDLDSRIEKRAGMSVSELFELRGEAYFRQIEREELQSILGDGAPAVVALGGGALLNRQTRLFALENAVVVTLLASTEETVRRLGSSRTRPLLDVADPSARIEEMSALRRTAYLEAHASIDTDRLAPESIAAEAREVWERDPIAVAAGERSYVVDVGTGLVEALLSKYLRAATSALLVTDDNVKKLHAGRVEDALRSCSARFRTIVLEPGETHKTLASVERIWLAALEASADRSSVVVALGGGVVSDVAGFSASGFMRGIGWIAMPSTLLAMVDASVGGKTGVDLGPAKNAIGAFWQPRGVLCDVGLLATEPERGYRSAFAEVVKTALIGDRELFGLLELETEAIQRREPSIVCEIVRRSVRVKARVVGQDERESGVRATLNLGHTVGHALESQAGFARLSHGEAISLGLVAALRIGQNRGLTPPEVAERSVQLLNALGLPTDLGAEPVSEALALIGHDKKRRGSTIRFVAARDIGRVDTVDLDIDAFRQDVSALV